MLAFTRRWGARALDIAAVLVLGYAAARFFVFPRLHAAPVAAPAVSLTTLAGPRFDLARSQGRVVFLDFFATWCEPCRASIPLVQRFKRAHPDVIVESVDVGEPDALARGFARTFAMRDVALDPDETVAHAFAVDGYPTLVAVDPRGTIVARWIGENPRIEQAMSDAAARYANRVGVR